MKTTPKFTKGQQVRVKHYSPERGVWYTEGEMICPPEVREPGWSDRHTALVDLDGRYQRVSNTRIETL